MKMFHKRIGITWSFLISWQECLQFWKNYGQFFRGIVADGGNPPRKLYVNLPDQIYENPGFPFTALFASLI